MKPFANSALALAATFAFISSSATAADQPPAAGIVNPFDKDDPQIQQLKKLDWKGVDFAVQPLKTRCVSLLALSNVLNRIGGKSDARLDLLVEYFNEHQLGQAFVTQMTDGPAQQPIPYSDTQKIAVAFVQTPMGSDKFGGDLEGCDDNTLKAYERLYEKSARAAYEQGVSSRLQVAAMGLFLQKQGKFDEFSKWAAAERQKRQEAYAKETAQRREQYLQAQQAEKDQRTAAFAQYQQQQRAAEDAASNQMEAGMQYQEQNAGAAPQATDQDQWNGDGYWPWTGAYYASNAYRGAVADRAQNSYQSWHGSRINAARARRR